MIAKTLEKNLMNLSKNIAKWLNVKKQYPSGNSFTRKDGLAYTTAIIVGLSVCSFFLYAALNELGEIVAPLFTIST